MLVYRVEDLKSIKESIADELKNNPEFVYEFDSDISRALYGIKLGNSKPVRAGIDIYVSEDGRNIKIREPMTKERVNSALPCTELRGTEINLREDGSMEIIEVHGKLYEGKKYYESIPQTNRYGSTKSVLATNYMYKRYDSNGIQTKFGYYANPNWGLDINYTDEDKFTHQLYSKGWHMPKKWDERGLPEPPGFVSSGTIIEGIHRVYGHNAIADIYKAELEPRFGCLPERKNIVHQRGYIHEENPEIIRIDNYQIFAEFKDGKYEPEPTEWYSSGEYEGKTCDEIQAMIEDRYPETVKASLERGFRSFPEITKEALKESFKIAERSFGDEK